MIIIFIATVIVSFALGRLFQGIRIRRLKRKLSDLQRQKVLLQEKEEVLNNRLMRMAKREN